MTGTEARRPRMTIPTQLVLGALLADPEQEMYGLQICAASGLPSGTVHPILARLEDEYGWLAARWEDVTPKDEGRPRRRYYRLTEDGAGQARAALARTTTFIPDEARAATVIRTGSGDLSDEELLAETRARLVRLTNTSRAEDDPAAGDETFIVNFDIVNAPATAVEAFPDLQQRVQLETILAAYRDSAGAIPAAAIPALTAGLGRLLDDVHRRSEADMYRILRTYAAQIVARLDGGERPTRQ